MKENKKSKQELFEYLKQLAEKYDNLKKIIYSILDEIDKFELEKNKNKQMIDKCFELKSIINGMLEEMEKIQLEYNKTTEEFKNN